MTKEIFFIRHAKSSWSNPRLPDQDRPLNKRGFRDAPFMATLLKNKGFRPDGIVSSQARRAYTTATYFAESIGRSTGAITSYAEIYEAFPEDVYQIIRQFPETSNTVYLFGHNPGFTSIANHFSEDYIPNVPTCGIIRVQLPISEWSEWKPERGRMLDFWYPKQYFPKEDLTWE